MTMAITGAATAEPLSRFIDHERVLVISAPASSNVYLRRQDVVLNAELAGLKARDVVVIRLVGDQAPDDRGDKLDTASVRRAVGLSDEQFGIALVGKDGGVKLRRGRPVTGGELFATIDAMPLRQAEMRRGGR